MAQVRLTTDMRTSGVFYTDSNGMGLLQRTSSPHAAQGAYPSVSYSLINDSTASLFVLNDRAQAVQSPANGSLELAVYDTFDIDPSCTIHLMSDWSVLPTLPTRSIAIHCHLLVAELFKGGRHTNTDWYQTLRFYS